MISKALLRQLFWFGLVGVSATATHYVVALMGHELLLTNIYLANLAGYLCAVMVSYYGHGRLTFRRQLERRVFVRFVVMSVSTFMLSEILLILLERYLKLPHRISLLVVVMSIPVLSFILAKLWVFRHDADSGNFPVADSDRTY